MENFQSVGFNVQKPTVYSINTPTNLFEDVFDASFLLNFESVGFKIQNWHCIIFNVFANPFGDCFRLIFGVSKHLRNMQIIHA